MTAFLFFICFKNDLLSVYTKFVMVKKIKQYFKNLVMTKPETLEEYYAKRPFLKTSDLSKSTEHFNIIPIEKQKQLEDNSVVSFGRKDYFKICLISGNSKIHYADKSFEILEHGLLFANPLIPYDWEAIAGKQEGYSCIFTELFIEDFGNIRKYPFFQPDGYPVFELSIDEKMIFEQIFVQMKNEHASEFEFKTDSLKNLIFQLIFAALKIRPSTQIFTERTNAAARITSLFMNLLENQFPIRNTIEGVTLRSASDFADQMSVHVNHLNKSVKEIMLKTTSEIITERILKEAKIMLQHSSWAISEIAYSLGFEGPAHFSSFFKKKVQLSPSQFRSEKVL